MAALADPDSSAVAPGVEPPPSANDHLSYMRLALAQAERSPPKPTNYCVGAVLVDERSNTILATGYTLELPGNTHAEQCCLAKYFSSKMRAQGGAATATAAAADNDLADNNVADYDVADKAALARMLPQGAVLYTTMEPCSERLSGNKPCVNRILALAASSRQGSGPGPGIAKVYVGVQEPEKFVGSNVGRKRLEDAGVEYVHVGGLEDRILAVATAGHDR